MKRILILAGTQEARTLVDRLVANEADRVIVSLAGVVARPHPHAGELRVGGFGGVFGLVAYLEREEITHVIDATHPFAAQMSANAVEACKRANIPLVRVLRPQWAPQSGDNWIDMQDLAQAASHLPAGARPFLAIGRKEIGVFAERHDLTCLMRMIDPPGDEQPLPPGRLILARPPKDPREEVSLFEAHGVSHVVAKNSGGVSGYAKIIAARNLKIPVLMVRRPDLLAAKTVSDIETACAWVKSG